MYKRQAQIMIIAGCEDGKVTSFPTWEQNLTFALKLQQTAETTVSYTHLDVYKRQHLLGLYPGNAITDKNPELIEACKVSLLDRDHYGLKDVKERILEFIAVRKLSPNIKGYR